ncbi:P-loop containing nucleoside triphosphate hydrolase protein [Haematococcus lacustris]
MPGLAWLADSSPPKRPRKASAKSKAQAEVQQEAGDCVVPEAEFLAVPPEDLECLEQGQGSQYLERLVPVYPALTPLDPADFFRYSSRQPDLITRALRGAAAAAEGAPDLLLQVPGLQPLQLLPWQTAIQAVHRPVSLRQLQDAFRRLAFQEMFFLQLQLLRQRAQFLKARSDLVSVPTISAPSVVAQALAALPFSLTGAQQRAVQELLADMQQPYPMFRLLQGDVGSGKTAVASLAMLAAAASGYQALLLVPTEILAQQHCQALTALVEGLPLATRRLPGLAEPPCLLTAATTATKKGKAVLVEGLQSGRLMLAVGTHSALNISDWSRLGLVVIDEQHRFGVEQKGQVMSLCSSLQPHLLSMSATPIPRTMALVKFGEMVVSALYEMPPGRSLVHTRVVTNDLEGEEEVHQAVRQEVSSGGRVFMVYPRRDAAPGAEEEGELAQLPDWELSPLALAAGQPLPSPQLLASEQALPGEALPQAQGKGSRVSAARRAAWESLSSAEEELERHTQLQTFGPGVKLGVIHGRMSSQAKADAIAGFREGQVQVLLSTSVVEVGVDVPQATLMVVHHAERFGLAQLHQLRGRVGRGQRQSRCLLVSGSYDVLALKRLRVMETCHNGLDIAEEDMKLRGAGSVFGTGTTQSGGSECSNLTLDAVTSEPRIVEAARVAAAHVIRSGMTDSELHYAAAAYAAHSSAKSRAKPAATKKPVKRKPATSSKKVVAAKPKSRTKKAASPVAAATLLPASPVTPRARKSASGKGIGLPV